MKLFAATVMLVALFLLYRIAYPKQAATKKGDDIPEKKEIDAGEVVGKSHFVRPAAGQSQTTPATTLNTEKQEEKANTFAPENGKIEVIVPFDRLDEIFDDEQPDEDDLDIPPDEDETDEDAPDAEEESEELRQVLGQAVELADGFSIEDMENAAKAIDAPTDENAGILYRVEKTDMFEKLVSGDEAKQQLITAVIDRHIRSLISARPSPQEKESEVANENNDKEYSNFNIADFLS
jgi:hypothetical protein